ncbi:MAG: hypothetical protein GX818_06865, partial [Tissierellia bacterium]|nr:hypothetical protein [Tissierellia bacterium]
SIWAVGSVAKKGKEKAVKAEIEETVDDKEEEDKYKKELSLFFYLLFLK